MPTSKRHYRVSLSDVLEAHERALEEGGRAGIISLDNLQSAIGRPYHGYYRPIYQKAAALTHSLCGSNHGFTDGNKRTAFYIVNLLLDRSGYELAPKRGDALPDFFADVAAGRVSFDELVVWFKDRIEKS